MKLLLQNILALPDKKALWWLALLTVTARVLFMLVFVDLHEENYWEYGEIARNLTTGRGYSLFYLLNGKIDIYYNSAAHPYPSAYVPPGYVFFLYPFMLLKNMVLRNMLILLIQHLIAAFTCQFIFRLTRLIFNSEAAWIAALLFALMPEMIYASNSFGPTVFYHFIVVLIFLQLLVKDPSLPRVLSIGGLFALAIYLRGEIFLFLIIITVFFIVQRKFLSSVLLFLTSVLLLLPWQIRNYSVFHQYIPISTSTGINLYRGNNAEGIGTWGWEKNVYNNTNSLMQDSLFELRFSGAYKKKALEFISLNPKKVLQNAAKKMGHLWLLQPNDPRSLHIAYWLPWAFILLGFFYGLFRSKPRHQLYPLYLFLISCSITCIIFFALPRYQTLMKIAVLPVAATGMIEIIKRFRQQ